MRRLALGLIACALGVGVAPAAAHQAHCTTPPEPDLNGDGLRLAPVGNFRQPVDLASLPVRPGHLLVVERRGRVMSLRNGVASATPFLDLSPEVSPTVSDELNERGMTSIAFSPRYRRTRRAYVGYSDADGDFRVDEFRVAADGTRVRMSSRRNLLRVEHSNSAMHYAGEIAFGPDGLLYVSLGDAHQSWLAQRAGLYGNVVRFDPRRPRRRSSFAIGLRNPYRFSFDRETGDFALADVGEDRYDELNFVPAGRKRKTNFGWPHFEGPLTRLTGTPPRRAAGPALALAHPYVSAVVGGYVVRDPRMRRHQGRYLFGDFCDGWLATTRLARSARDTRLEGLTVPYLSGFGQAANGRLYATSIAGPVYAVLEAAPAAPRQ